MGTNLALLALIVTFIVITIIPLPANAQNEEQAEITPEKIESNTRPIEQIEVRGQRTLVSMRYQLRLAEDSLYKLFNDLNSADKYDILCKTERTTRSLIPQHTCEPEFFLSMRQEVNRNALIEMRGAFTSDGYDPALYQLAVDKLEPDSEVRARLTGDYEGLEQEMFRIATENEDYREQLIRVGELKAQYETARETRFNEKDED